MSLVDRQHNFSIRIAKLLLYADSLGYQVSGGDWYRDIRCNYGAANSKHRNRLAFDINLHKDGMWLTDTLSHEPLGLYWEAMGGKWGGRFTNKDGNHYEE